MNIRANDGNGMTLIETVLYLALFALIFISVMQFSLAVAESNRAAVSRNKVEHTLIFVTEHLGLRFEEAQSINEGLTLLETNGGVLCLTSNGEDVTYSVSNGILQFSESGVVSALSNSSVVVESFYLEEVLDNVDQLVGIRLTLEIASKDGTYSDSIVTAYTL